MSFDLWVICDSDLFTFTCVVWIQSVDPVAYLCLTKQVLYGTIPVLLNDLSRAYAIPLLFPPCSPRPRGCKTYPALPCELTQKLTGTAVRA